MKKLVLLLCLFIVGAQTIHAQQIDSATVAAQQRWYNYYSQKHKSRSTTGWVLLGTGLAALGGGLYLVGQGFSEYPSVEVPAAITIFVAAYGVGATLTSIPYFISAGTNKRKARLALKGEMVKFGNKYLPNSGYTAFSIALPL